MSNPEEVLPPKYEISLLGSKKKSSFLSPRLLTPEVENKILSVLLVGGSETAASEYAGIAYPTYKVWKKAGETADIESPDPAEAKMAKFYMDCKMATAEDKVGDLAMLKKIIKDNAEGKDPVAVGKLIIDALKLKYPEDYNPMRGHKGGTTVIQDNREIILSINNLSDEKLNQLLEITEELDEDTVDAEYKEVS